MTQTVKYEDDFHGWAMSTAALLRAKQYDKVDYQHIIEELECMGASERRELINRLAQLIFHMLKWQFQAHLRSRSWKASITEQRKQVLRLLQQNPGLKPKVQEYIADAYDDAGLLIEKETPIEPQDLPPETPYSIEELLDWEYYPK